MIRIIFVFLLIGTICYANIPPVVGTYNSQMGGTQYNPVVPDGIPFPFTVEVSTK